ncbi:MAG: hypothetical protein ACOC5T_09215 [Elusimicrobiota bacterium]
MVNKIGVLIEGYTSGFSKVRKKLNSVQNAINKFKKIVAGSRKVGTRFNELNKAQQSTFKNYSEKLGVTSRQLARSFQNQNYVIGKEGKVAFQKGTSGAVKMDDAMKNSASSISKTSQVMGKLAAGLGVAANIIGGVGKAVFSLGKKVLKLKNRIAGFRPEWLSVMFISMHIRKIFNSMLKPVGNLLEVFELFKITMISLLLPVLLPLYLVLVDIATWIMDLPKPLKKLIGAIILAGAAFASVLFFASQLVIMFSSLGIGIGTITAMLLPFAGVLTAVTGAFLMFGDATREEADEIIPLIDKTVNSAISGIKKAGKSIRKMIPEGRISDAGRDIIYALADGIVGVIGVLAQTTAKVIEKFTVFFKANKNMILEIGNDIFGMILDGLLYVLYALDPFVKEFISTLSSFFEDNKDKLYKISDKVIGWLIDFFIEFLPDVLDLGLRIVEAIADGIVENREDLEDAVEDISERLSEAVEELTPTFISLGLTVGSAIGIGIVKGTKEYIRNNWKDAFKPGGILAAPYSEETDYPNIWGSSEEEEKETVRNPIFNKTQNLIDNDALNKSGKSGGGYQEIHNETYNATMNGDFLDKREIERRIKDTVNKTVNRTRRRSPNA